MIGLDENGDRVCGPCCGINVDFTCTDCGIVGKLYEKGRCASCALTRRLAVLLADDTGTIPDRLIDVHHALTTATIGGPSVGWLARRDGRTAPLLADLARDVGREITHDQLDAVPDHRSADSLRALLVHVGVLPERPEHLDRIEPWLRSLAAELPAHVSQPLRAYARWSVLPRKRARLAARSPQVFTPGAGEHARAKIRAALDLLTWLDEQHLSLDQLTQPDLDRHLLTLSANRRSQLRPFITWAIQHKRASLLQIPAATRHDPHVFLDDARRTEILRRCVTDTALPLRVRAAGTLVLLFGLTVPRIITLTDQHLAVTPTAVHLMVAERPLLIPPRVATLMVELRDQQHVVHQSAAMPASQPVLLFPGRRPTHTIHPATLARNLRKHGIPIQSSRNTARAALAEDLPAPVLAELIGLDPTTTGRWAKHVARTWQPYLAARIGQP